MATVAQLRERLRKPLQLELQNGCRDTSVVGGLEKLLGTVGKPFADVARVMEGYGQLTPERRAERLKEALRLLDEQEAAAPRPSPPRRREGRAGRAGARPAAGTRAAGGPRQSLTHESLDSGIEEGLIDLGQGAAKKLAQVGVRTYRDLLYYLPRKHEDRRTLPSLASLNDGDMATVAGTVRGVKGMRSRRGLYIFRAFLEDHQGSRLTAVWFNQPWLEKQVWPGQRLIVSGRAKVAGRQREIGVQHMEVDDDSESLSTGRIVPVYPSVQGLSQAYLRRAVHRLLQALELIPDHLPLSILRSTQLIPLGQALRTIHFPESAEEYGSAERRLKFDEFLLLELRMLLNRSGDVQGKRITASQEELARFEASLPFSFTAAQRRALDGILQDLASGQQMARLLQGDVGSGKTAVAAAAVYAAALRGFQSALMAPTEILARQHFLNLRDYLYPLGMRSQLLTGSMGAAQRREALGRIASGEATLAVGTHALIQEGVEFERLGLAVIDEEHRFGVEQRRKLLHDDAHVLVMSATPIPRSLALTVYGDLELSVIDELPPGRKEVRTSLVDASRRREVYHRATEEIRRGHQVFLVTPLIEESEALGEVVSTTQMYEDLKQILPPDCRIEMLHGRMSGEEKDQVMERFRRHEFDLLVSTTVIEVGVDIPNATLMIIENAERFGLSQLHQLRGRVGRGGHEATCILVAGERSRSTQKRLEVIQRSNDGFEIAEKDLALRGPGELRGTRQSGLPDLQLGSLVDDTQLIAECRELAKRILQASPDLEAAWAARLKAELQRRSHALGLRQVI